MSKPWYLIVFASGLLSFENLYAKNGCEQPPEVEEIHSALNTAEAREFEQTVESAIQKISRPYLLSIREGKEELLKLLFESNQWESNFLLNLSKRLSDLKDESAAGNDRNSFSNIYQRVAIGDVLEIARLKLENHPLPSRPGNIVRLQLPKERDSSEPRPTLEETLHFNQEAKLFRSQWNKISKSVFDAIKNEKNIQINATGLNALAPEEKMSLKIVGYEWTPNSSSLVRLFATVGGSPHRLMEIIYYSETHSVEYRWLNFDWSKSDTQTPHYVYYLNSSKDTEEDPLK